MAAATPAPLIPRAQRRVFVYLLAALFVETLFFVVLSPLLPVYARELHLSRSAAGLMSASYSIGYGLAAIPAGAAVGFVGARRVSLGGLTLVGVSCAAFGVARVPGLLDLARAADRRGRRVRVGWVDPLAGVAGGRSRPRSGDRRRVRGGERGILRRPGCRCAGNADRPAAVFVALSIVIGLLVVWGLVVSAGNEPPIPTRTDGGVRQAIAAMRDGLRAPRAGVALAMVALPTVGLGACGVLLPLRLRGLGVAEVGDRHRLSDGGGARSSGESADRPVVRSSRRRGRPALGVAGVRRLRDAAGVPLAGGGIAGRAGARVPGPQRLLGPGAGPVVDDARAAGAAPGVALGLFNVSWAIFQVVGCDRRAELSRVGLAVPFLLLSVLFAAGVHATSRLAGPLVGGGAEPGRGSR